MDDQEEQPRSEAVEAEQPQAATDGAVLTAGQLYWQEHEIVRRSPEEIRRGEAPVYVRRRG
jgi:hypothetical protein